MVTGIHHIAIIVSSESVLDFYKSFGFSETFRKERNYDTVVLMEGLGMELEVFIDPKHPKREIPEPLGIRHMAFRVDNLLEMMENHGLSEEDIKTDWIGRKYCFIEDPDGNTLELHE